MKLIKRLMTLSMIFLTVSSLSLMLICFADYSGNSFNIIMAIVVGAMFWTLLAAGYIIFAVMNMKRKKFQIEHNENTQEEEKKSFHLPGVLRFYSNKFAFVTDSLMILLFILILVFLFIQFDNQGLIFIFVSLFVLSLHLHGIFNGINFQYIRSTKESAENEGKD